LSVIRNSPAADTKAEVVTYKGRSSLRLVEDLQANSEIDQEVALISGTGFEDGTLDVDLAGTPTLGALQ
jgi:hypothetical protein